MSSVTENGVTRVQIFSGEGFKDRNAKRYGVRVIPATFLVDENGTLRDFDLRGADREKRVGDFF